MPYTDNFRRQHDEILAIAGDIARELEPRKGGGVDAKQVRTLLSALAGKLTVHLAMEDKALYPRLAATTVQGARETAQVFMKEMGGIGAAFAAYNQKWQAGAIAANAEGFARETASLFAALGQRIERENAQLYPLADRALGKAVAAG